MCANEEKEKCAIHRNSRCYLNAEAFRRDRERQESMTPHQLQTHVPHYTLYTDPRSYTLYVENSKKV